MFVQQTVNVPDDNDPNDQFGGAVGAMIWENDRALVVGIPGEDMGQGAVAVLRVEFDPLPDTFVASAPATIFSPADAGLSLGPQAHWGEVIAPPRAFPTKPVELPWENRP
jgi:hypothetical protein